MAKKKSKVEETLSDVRKGQKLVRDAVGKLDETVKQLKKDLEEARETLEEKHKLLQDLFGEHYNYFIDGYRFERHVVWWMNKNYPHYELKIWQGDKFAPPYKDGDLIYASWNKYPDLIYVDAKHKKAIALECKYRYDGRLELDSRQYSNYKNFETQIKELLHIDTEVYLMVGSGRIPNRPGSMYAIPID